MSQSLIRQFTLFNGRYSLFSFFSKKKDKEQKICSYKYYSFSALVRPKFCSNTDVYVLFPKAHSTSRNDACCKSPHIMLKLAIKRPNKQFKTFIFFSWLMGDVFFVYTAVSNMSGAYHPCSAVSIPVWSVFDQTCFNTVWPLSLTSSSLVTRQCLVARHFPSGQDITASMLF